MIYVCSQEQTSASVLLHCFTFSRTLLNPIDFGFPNTRRRFYLLAKRRSLGEEPCPSGPPTVQPRPVSHFLEEKKMYRLAVSNLDWLPSESEFLLVHSRVTQPQEVENLQRRHALRVPAEVLQRASDEGRI